MAMHATHGRDNQLSMSGEEALSGLAFRDGLTIERLSHAVDGLPDLRIESFDADWWDGQAHGPCLVVRFGTGSKRRVVETAGDAVVLPLSRRRAARELAERRAPRRAEIGLPPMRIAPDDVILDAGSDAVRCADPNCGAMRPTDVSGPCPRCGCA